MRKIKSLNKGNGCHLRDYLGRRVHLRRRLNGEKMNFLRWIRSTIPGLHPNGRQLQDLQDAQEACMLLTHYNWYQNTGKVIVDSREYELKIQERFREIENLTIKKYQTKNQQMIHQQVFNLFNLLHSNLQPKKAFFLDNSDSQLMDPDQFRVLPRIEKKQPWKMIKDDLQKNLGFSTFIESSKATLAGDGVFLDGSAVAGTVIAFYPGVVYLPENLKKEEDIAKAFQGDNDFMIGISDKAIIDGKFVGKDPKNPFAVGHIINHPPPSKSPNVMCVPYDFPNEEFFENTMNEYLPNSYVSSPSSTTSPLVKSLAVVATKYIEDEELFLNYRLNPNNGFPSWYTPVDIEADRKQWGA